MPTYRVQLTFLIPVGVDETVEAPDEDKATEIAFAAAQKQAGRDDLIFYADWDHLVDDEVSVERVGDEE